MSIDNIHEAMRAREDRIFVRNVIIFTSLFVAIVVAFLAGWPQYKVWKDGLRGKAELSRAEWNRQIQISEAEARSQSAVHWAAAEIERAKGAAEANKIVAEYLGGPEAYLRWLFIEQLPKIEGQIVYLPTEAGMPILEAGKR